MIVSQSLFKLSFAHAQHMLINVLYYWCLYYKPWKIL